MPHWAYNQTLSRILPCMDRIACGAAVGGESDVDVIADFDRTKKLTLVGRVHLENRLTDILGVKADLAQQPCNCW